MIRSIGVVGAGNMGSGIAQKAAQEGFQVQLLDLNSELVDQGLQNIGNTLKEAVERRLFSADQVEEFLSRVKPAYNVEDLAQCDLIIEAVFEDLEVKAQLFRDLDKACQPHTILATNTSSLSVGELAKAVKRKDRFVGLHFFYHPAKNRFLEIIPLPGTLEQVRGDIDICVARLGKVSVLAKDRPGFVVNRFFVPLLNESVRLLEQGIGNIPAIDKVSAELTGAPAGTFTLMNMTGIPIAHHSAETLGNELGPFYAACPKLASQSKSEQQWDLNGEDDPGTHELIRQRLAGAIFLVAGQMLDEEVASIEDIEKGARVALRWRQGPFDMMNRAGSAKALAWAHLVAENHGLAVPASLEGQLSQDIDWSIRQIRSSVEGSLGRLTICRPETMNALNPALVEELFSSLEGLQGDPVVEIIVLEGEGKAFVAGADIGFFLKRLKEEDLEGIETFTRRGHELMALIENSNKPVICKLSGFALGGGAELALACHSIIATPNTYLAFPETGIGIYPGLGGTQRLSRRVGPALAKYFILTGTPIPAKMALELGLVSKVLELQDMDPWLSQLGNLDDDKYERSCKVPAKLEAMVRHFTELPIEGLLEFETHDGQDPQMAKVTRTLGFKAPLALRMAWQLIERGYPLALEQGLELELSHLKDTFSTADAREGLASVGRGRPTFEGR